MSVHPKEKRKYRKHEKDESIKPYDSALGEAEHLYSIAVGFESRMKWRRRIDELTSKEYGMQTLSCKQAKQ